MSRALRGLGGSFLLGNICLPPEKVLGAPSEAVGSPPHPLAYGDREGARGFPRFPRSSPNK